MADPPTFDEPIIPEEEDTGDTGDGAGPMPEEAPPAGHVWVKRPNSNGEMRWVIEKVKDPADYNDTTGSAEEWARGIFDSPAGTFKAWKDYWSKLKDIARKYKLDPVALAAVALTHLGTNPTAGTSAPMAVVQDLAKLMARRDKRGVRAYDSLDDWYASEIDPSAGGMLIPGTKDQYTGLNVLPGNVVGNYSITWPTLPKKPLTEKERLRQRLKREKDYKDATDPVVYLKGKNGEKIPLMWFGSEVRQSDFYRFKQQWDPIFLAYAGRRASTEELASIIVGGSSEYEVTRKLVNSPDFFKSPTWKSRQPEYATVAEDIFGTGYRPPKDLVKRAILNNWSGGTFASFLRKDPSYTKSNEFQTRSTQMANIYREIYGEPDDEAMVNIREAAAAQWTPDQWASYLRAQPGYTEGKEYESKMLGFSTMLAGMMGGLATDVPAGIPNENRDTSGPLPDSQIVEGSPTPKTGIGATGESGPGKPAPPRDDQGQAPGGTKKPMDPRELRRRQQERDAREAAAKAARRKYAAQAGGKR